MQPGHELTFHDGTCCKCGSSEDLIRFSEFGKALCPDCFPEFVRRRIEGTLRRFRMIPKGAHAAVAVSGGSDSGALLHALARTRARLNFSLSAVHIDMGLGEYSRRSLQVARQQCAGANVTLHDDAVARHGVQIAPLGRWPVCAVCGAVRRALLPRLARRIGADVLCMGHTLDDQLQFMMKNILSGHAISPAPVLPATSYAPAKVKPLIQVPDQATDTYVRLVGIPTVAEPCPRFVPDSHRFKDVFELLEQHAPMGKLQFWRVLRKVMRPADEGDDAGHLCSVCGEPTSMPVCTICRLRQAQQEDAQH